MNAPGSIAKHAIIAPACRAGRGDMGAFNEAVERLRAEYVACLPYHADRGSKFHLLLTVEKAAAAPTHSESERRTAAIAGCPTPAYHETHRYCPSCPWTEDDVA